MVGIYFFAIVQALVDWGYTRDEDVRGAPYDWRKAPSEYRCCQAQPRIPAEYSYTTQTFYMGG